MKKWLKILGEKLQEIIDRVRGKDPRPTEPEIPDAPAEPGEPVNKGGDGLYKPESRLWLLPAGIKAPDVGICGEAMPDGDIRYFRLGNDSGQRADGNQKPGNIDDYYHPPSIALGRLKMRDAKASRDGARFLCFGTGGGLLAEMIVKDRDVRQEGRR
jgi:hypothetical protein